VLKTRHGNPHLHNMSSDFIRGLFKSNMPKKSSTKKQLKTFGKKAGLTIAKMAVDEVMRNGAAQKVLGKENSDDISRMVNRSIDKKLKKVSGSGFYGSGRGFYSGRGSYEQTISNQLVAGTNVRPATLSSSGDETGEIIISKREYLTDMFSTGSTAFYLESFGVNPGLPGVFPFLSQIATNYTTYEFIQLIFEYVPVVSQASTTGAMGTIILACNGNAAAGPFASKVEMNEYDGAISGRVCDHLVLGIECDPRKLGLQPTLYVRAGSVQTGQDIKTYDLGLFQIGLSGVSPAAFPTGTQLGEIWVHYRLKLRKPRLYDALGFNVPRDVFYSSGAGSTAVLPFGSAPYKSLNNVIGGRLSKSVATTYTFPDNYTGYTEIILVIQGATVTNASGIVAVFGGITGVNDIEFSGAAAGAIQNGSGTATMTYRQHVFVPIATAPGVNYFSVSLTTFTTPGSLEMEVFQYNPLPGYVFAASGNSSSMVLI